MKGMLKKRKSKSGSVILMVLMVSTILIILSAVVMNSLIFTTVNNDLVKHKSDYLYAAEGGMEAGIIKYNEIKGPFTTFNVEFLKDTNPVEEKDIADVIVEYKEDATGKKIVSTVINKDNDQLAQIVLPIGENKKSMINILRYSMCTSGLLDIQSAGAANMEESQVAHNPAYGKINYLPDGAQTVPANDPDNNNPKSDSMEIDSLEPKFYEKYLPKSKKAIKASGFADIISRAKKNVLPDNPDDMSELPVSEPYLGSFTVAADGLHSFDVIVINGDVDIKFDSGSNIMNTIFICSGNLNIVGGKESQMLTGCTIYSKSILIQDGANLHMSYSPKFAGATGTGTGYQATQKQVDYIDSVLDKYMSNWGASGGSNAGDNGEIKYDDIEYIIQ